MAKGSKAFRSLVATAEKLAAEDWNKVSDFVGAMRNAGRWIGDPALVSEINGKLYLVDGHHRSHAAMEAGVDIVYEMVDPADLPKRIFRTAGQIVQDAAKTGGWSSRP